jgi:hypothetical protein
VKPFALARGGFTHIRENFWRHLVKPFALGGAYAHFVKTSWRHLVKPFGSVPRAV